MRAQGSRLEVIDFLRGIAILEMVVTHFAAFYPVPLEKAVTYTETAMALFVLLAGFMVGWQYPSFKQSPREQTLSLWKRALRVVAAQYVLILTLGVPLFLIGMPHMGNAHSLPVFLLQSATFYNQLGLLHVLPT